MEKKTNTENERAKRIAVRMNINHSILANIYESLVDREFKYAERDLREIIYDLRLILKSIPDDDF
jgi:predicted transcriptional regulator